MHTKDKITQSGFAIVEELYTDEEINALTRIISYVDTSNPTFRKTDDLFAIRQFFKEVPVAINLVFNRKLISLIEETLGDSYFPVKSIYFDKPEKSNWFVAWHQDLSISVDKKLGLEGFGPWTVKHNQFAVQPPLSILEDNFTIRIHLDDTNENMGR